MTSFCSFGIPQIDLARHGHRALRVIVKGLEVHRVVASCQSRVVVGHLNEIPIPTGGHHPGPRLAPYQPAAHR